MSQTGPDNGERSFIGVFTTDTDLVVRTWDAALESMTGIAATEAVGKPVTEIIPDLRSRGLLARFELVLSEGTTEVLAPALHKFLIQCPDRFRTKHFSEMRQLVTISALREDQQITGVVVVVEDVTDRMSEEQDLAARLQNADDAVRLEAAKALLNGSDTITREDAEPIINALGDKNWRVRRKLVESLSQRSAPEAVTALLAAVREEHLDFGLLNSALQILQASSVDAAETLIEFLNTGDADLRMQAALALGHQANNPAAVSSLIETLDDENANVRYHAIEALGKLKASEAVEPLLAIAESRDPFLSFAALEALKEIGDVSAARRVLLLLEDHFLSEAAVGVLGVSGGVETVDAIVGLLNDGSISVAAAAAALAALNDRFKTGADREQIFQRFRARINADGESALIRALESSGAAVASGTILVASWIHEDEVRGKLAALAANAHTRDAAIKALAGQGDAAVPQLVEMLGSDDRELQNAAVASLGEIGSESSVEALLLELHSGSETGPAAAQALAGSGSMAAFSGLIDVLATGDKVLQRAAVSALKSLSHSEKEARLLALVTDADPNVREAVIRIIGEFGTAESDAAILASCGDSSESVRTAAIEQLAELPPGKAVPILTKSVSDGSPRVRATAVQALGKFGGDESTAALRSALGDADAWTRYFAVRSLADTDDLESRDLIRRMSESDEAEQVRAAAAEVRAKI